MTTHWTNEEIETLTEMRPNHSYKEIAKILNRSEPSVSQKYRQLGMGKKNYPQRKWTEDELETLGNATKRDSYQVLSKKLNRGVPAIKRKMAEQGIELIGKHAEYLLVAHVASNLHMDKTLLMYYFRRYNMKMGKYKIKSQTFYTVDSMDFWDFARVHPDKLNLKAYERYSIVPEPNDVRNIINSCTYQKRNIKPWSSKEIQQLMTMRKEGYFYKDISEALNRGYKTTMSKYYEMRKIYK